MVYSEKSFEGKVRRYLSEQGAWVLKTWGGGMQRSGVPDLLVCLNGIFFGIELKAEKGKPSELQKYNVYTINNAGGIGMILYPAGYEDFKKLISEVITCTSHIQELSVSKVAHTNSNCDILTSYEPFQTTKQRIHSSSDQQSTRGSRKVSKPGSNTTTVSTRRSRTNTSTKP